MRSCNLHRDFNLNIIDGVYSQLHRRWHNQGIAAQSDRISHLVITWDNLGLEDYCFKLIN